MADRNGRLWAGLAEVAGPVRLELGVGVGGGAIAGYRPTLVSCLVEAPSAHVAASRCLAVNVQIQADYLTPLTTLDPATPAYQAATLLSRAPRLLRPATDGRVLLWPSDGGPVVLAVHGEGRPRRVGVLTVGGHGQWVYQPDTPTTARGGGTGAGRVGDRVRSSVYLDRPDHDRIGTLSGEAGVVPAEMHRQVVKAGLAALDGSPWQPRLADMWAAGVAAQQTVADLTARHDAGQGTPAELGWLIAAESRVDTIAGEYARLVGADPEATMARLIAEAGG